MKKRLHARPRRSAGFSLIEIMVGLVIAMLGVTIMLQTLLSSEERGRAANSGNDAMSNGAVTLNALRRDIAQAGYGLNSLALFSCSLTMPGGVAVPLIPLVINPASTFVASGKDANTDSVMVFYGNDTGQPEGNAVLGITGSAYTVQSPSSFHVGDYVMAYTGSCGTSLSLQRVTALDASASTVTVDGTAVSTATILYDLGPSPVSRAYMVKSGALVTCDFMTADCRTYNAANWTAASGDVVSMRAVYGRDSSSPMDGVVDVWDQTTPTSSCEWAKAPAVKLALVARSSQYESRLNAVTGLRECDQVTAAAPTWDGSGVAPIDLSADTSWQCYRYRTFENVVPLRNLVWMGVQSGC